MTERLLVCTDLDRTLIPNGPQTESTDARQHFAALVIRPEQDEVRDLARRQASDSDGMLEGIAHYHPNTSTWMAFSDSQLLA